MAGTGMPRPAPTHPLLLLLQERAMPAMLFHRPTPERTLPAPPQTRQPL